MIRILILQKYYNEILLLQQRSIYNVWTDIARFLQYFRSVSNILIYILAILQDFNGIFLKYYGAMWEHIYMKEKWGFPPGIFGVECPIYNRNSIMRELFRWWVSTKFHDFCCGAPTVQKWGRVYSLPRFGVKMVEWKIERGWGKRMAKSANIPQALWYLTESYMIR